MIRTLPRTIVPTTTAAAAPRAGWLDRMLRKRIFHALARLQSGGLTVLEQGRVLRFGPDLHSPLHLEVHHPRFYRAAALGGSLGAGEAYIRGDWTVSDLPALIRLLVRNQAALSGLDHGWGRLMSPLHRVWHALRRNTRAGARRNIVAHYDLSNDFYRLWLDETMTYSCGIFTTPQTSLRDASLAKIDRICRKLQLAPGQHLLEIGTGWGALALHAARHYGVRVTTTTISDQQHDLAAQRIHAAGLSNQVTLLKRDYRDLTGQFDRLVSVEMIEAVGHHYYDAFFRQCSRLLKPDGLLCLQAITMADRYYLHARHDVDFIKRYIFPGSCIPSIGAMTGSVARATPLTLVHLEDITPHYAETLRRWRTNFFERIDAVRALGYTDPFVRMWDYYLSYCEAGFDERTIGTVQMLLAGPAWRGAAPLPDLTPADHTDTDGSFSSR